jgi:16S rRNA processing protein RimM
VARRRVAVGRINGAWGLRGHVKVTSLTTNPRRFQPGSVLLIDGEPREILDVATPKGYPCVQFEGCTSRSAADSLRGTLIEIDESDLPKLAEGEYYTHQLVGLIVVTRDGDEVGRLDEVLRTGANDVYLVRRKGRRDVLIPAIEDVVRSVDLTAGRMTIEPLEGLLDN